MSELKELEESLKDFPLITLNEGDCLINQDEHTDSLYFLETGKVLVIKDGFDVALTDEKGVVFGEMSILLGIPHSATVQCVEESTFYKVDNPKDYLVSNPEVIWHIASILSQRLYNLNQYLVDMKRLHEGSEGQHMVDRDKMINDVLKILQIT